MEDFESEELNSAYSSVTYGSIILGKSCSLRLILWLISKINVFIYLTSTSYTSLLFSRSVVFDSLWPHGLQHASLPCPSLSPRVCWKSGPLSQWCLRIQPFHPVASFSFCLLSFPASGSFPMSRLFTSGDQSIGASASASVLQWIFSVDFL